MAVIVDPDPFATATSVNLGYGSHLCATVAATRAITEAAQSRLTYIHGAREDIPEETYYGGAVHRSLAELFSEFEPDTDWGSLGSQVTSDLFEDYALVLKALKAQGRTGIYRACVGEQFPILSVVKVFIEGALTSFPI
jgi:ribosomal protein S12 methylthiotransferase accessory factor